MSIVAPHTGNYYIEISQQMYERPNQVWYRAHIGNFTRPTGIYPAGGQAGQQLAVEGFGAIPWENALNRSYVCPKLSARWITFSGPKGPAASVAQYPARLAVSQRTQRRG